MIGHGFYRTWVHMTWIRALGLLQEFLKYQSMFSQDSHGTQINGPAVHGHLVPYIHTIYIDIKHILPHTHGIFEYGTPFHFHFGAFCHKNFN